MALMSPGVEVKEIDLSIIVPKISAVIAAFAGVFEKGPIGQAVLVTSVAEFRSIFGGPSNENYNDWFQVYSFLQYSNKIYVSRAVASSGTTNAIFEIATAGSVNTYLNPEVDSSYWNLYKNAQEFEIVKSSNVMGTDTALKFIAKDAGLYGNDIEIAVAVENDFLSGTSYAFPGVLLNNLFESVPATDNYEVAVAIRIGGVVKETYIVSMDETAKDYQNKSIFIEEVINRKSSYVYVIANGTALPNSMIGSPTYDTIDTKIQLSGSFSLYGATEGTIDEGDLETALGSVSDGTIFGNKESLDIDLIIANEAARAAAGELAYNRADCICFVGPKFEDVVGVTSTTAVSNMITDVNSFSSGLTSSFAAYFGNYLYIYDSYNDKYRWISPAGIAAGLRADITDKRASWYASAGLDNGRVKLAQKLAFIPSQGQRDLLYKAKINPIAQFPGNGIVVYGQKTLQSKPSSLDRINVRGLFNVLERSISRMAKYYVFEINDSFTRNRFVATVTPFLQEVKTGRGIYDFAVLCDDTNNPASIVDANQFVASIAVKPARIAEFISLEFMAVGTSVNFSEVFAS